MACRFAGTATNPEALWGMLANGLDGWSDEAPDRFNLQSFWHPKADIGGSFATRGLHLLKQDPALFDADFFGIHNLEAGAMDPQQRLLLEVAYESIENAGIPLEKIRGSNTAVYCSTSNCDYEIMLSRSPETAPK
ncbi:hypothetical protein N0V90_012493 [Kalmusia sp. IMI 367209]|nr:hypothetical protein N0V90_012493 [Kalmusia sp. IMI 367209]